MVATTDRYASEIGRDVLRAGGNAVDAAVAVSFALAVVNPEAGNLGGSGFLVGWSPDGGAFTLDYRSTAPGQATRDMFRGQRPGQTSRSLLGHLSAAVPGAVRGLSDAHERLGSRPWEELVEPARLLAKGFKVRERLVASFPPHIVEGLRRFPESRKIFLPRRTNGDPGPPRMGDTLSQPDLARTLERIRDHGADGFYRGRTADLIVEEMERGGGIITHEDLAGYAPVWRDPVRFTYRGYSVVSMPPSSSGGVALAQMCHILETFSLRELEWHESRHIHLLAEAWRRVYADRNHYLADADFAEIPIEALLSRSYGARRAEAIDLERATPSDRVTPGDSGGDASSHTTHVSIVDSMGGAASLTTTLNTWYGSKLVVAGAGFLLNNEMDDFTVAPGVPNSFDLIQGEANAIEPGKRMLSAMTPTIVLAPRGDLFMVVGSPGGATIITTVFQVISNVIDHGMTLEDAVDAPRVHHQHLPDRIECEPGGLSQRVIQELTALGHRVEEDEKVWGDVQAIQSTPEGTLLGVSDSRRGGTALGL